MPLALSQDSLKGDKFLLEHLYDFIYLAAHHPSEHQLHGTLETGENLSKNRQLKTQPTLHTWIS